MMSTGYHGSFGIDASRREGSLPMFLLLKSGDVGEGYAHKINQAKCVPAVAGGGHCDFLSVEERLSEASTTV